MSCNFCLFSKFFNPKPYVLKSFTHVIIHMDFVGFPFKNSKLKNKITYIRSFQIDLGRFVGDWTCIIQILQ
jgi:hypothetical protein